MLIKKLAVGFKPIALAVMFVQGVAMTWRVDTAQAEVQFHLEKDPHGLIRPFRAVLVPLAEFVREYGRITSTQMIVGGNWDKELKGSVTLLMRQHLKQDQLTDIFHRVLGDNGYAVVDGSVGKSWIVKKTRDARDDILPLYEILKVPDSSRLVTAFQELKYVDAESVARMMRSFMPANSRIVPTSKSQIFVTDIASNIRKLHWIISRMDTQDGAKKLNEEASSRTSFGRPRNCGEHRIEKLVVEKLEIQDNDSIGQAPQMKMGKERGRK